MSDEHEVQPVPKPAIQHGAILPVGIAAVLGLLANYFFFDRSLGISLPIFAILGLLALFGLSYAREVKPAWRNAWLAGVPAMVGPESAYRALRRDASDFIEVSSRAEAEAAVLRLLEEPGLYARMRQRAAERAVDCSIARVTQRWMEVLGREIPQLAVTARVRRSHRLPLLVRNVVGRVRRLLHGRR